LQASKITDRQKCRHFLLTHYNLTKS
jgi:hypothetical protein